MSTVDTHFLKMWDVKNITNQCVKCGCKFTSAENPLKLLPCLHSMCLNCLNGITPVDHKKIVDKKSEENKKTEISTEKPDSKSDENSKVENSNDEVGAVNKEGADNISDDKTEVKNTPDQENSTENEDVSKTAINGDEENEKSSVKDVEPSAVTVSEDKKEESQTVDEKVSEEKPKPVTECPVCKDPIDIPPEQLMDNMFAALDPNQPSSPKDETKHECTACDESREAFSYCVQCEEWLCSDCVDAHKRVRVTKDHTILPKDQVTSVTSKSPWEQHMTCKQHKNEQLKFFCEKCEKLTCRDCQLMDHKDHKYQFLDQAAEQYKARLKGSLALMGEKRSKLAANQDEITLKLNNCKEQKDALQQDILKQADVLVKAVRQAVWGVLNNLASFTDAATKRLNKEIDDVKDLVTKFDHCIKFMEDILEEGSSMSLLFSKGNVESKCRKVYHTQVDPQSLKGNLQIQYRHDVNFLLNSLAKIGSIYVNNVRYPPEKNNNAANLKGHPGGPKGQGYSVGDNKSGGMTGSSPHLQHMANQSIPGAGGQNEWTAKYIQSISSKPSPHPQGGPPNMTPVNLGGPGASNLPQLSLPNRRGHQMGQGWPGVNPNIPAAGSFVAGQLLTPQQQQNHRPQQQQQQQQQPAFTPMRLNHRPATINPQQFMASEQNGRPPQSSPPGYRLQGGEAGAGAHNPPRPAPHGTPDPARPASAGMYQDPHQGAHPGSAQQMMKVKKEHRDTSPDCVITSSHLKADRPTVFQTSPAQAQSRMSDTVLEMQRNLDDVIRAVPMNIGESLEQIGGTTHKPVENGAKEPTPEPERATTPTDAELRENWKGGNSMPGFSVSQGEQDTDPSEDYCACCHNGGDVLCCDTCPKVFHLNCHIPEMAEVPDGAFLCTLCVGDRPVDPEAETTAGKRKNPGGLTDAEVATCQRILLELWCHPSSLPFQEPVNRGQVPNYYKIITQPVDFTSIRCKLARSHANHYHSLKAFLHDLRQVFINCAIYNKAGSEVGKAGKIVRALFEELVARLMGQHIAFVKDNPSPGFTKVYQTDPNTAGDPAGEGDGDAGPSEPKKAKLDTAVA